ncbi:MAG: FMN-binding protein [Planctomycetes bacterium]|nr:FMN-binding protein [Planctomycetota bacterium]
MLLFAALTLLPAAPAITQQGEAISEAEAVDLAFPKCDVVRAEFVLTKEQHKEAAKLADTKAVPTKGAYYVARKKGVVQGRAYVDSRRVRSQVQTLLVVLDAAGSIRRVEILVWNEPSRYRPRAAFWKQFEGKKLDGTLRLRRGIRPVTGATLSAAAAVDAVRTVLSVHAILNAANPDGDS